MSAWARITPFSRFATAMWPSAKATSAARSYPSLRRTMRRRKRARRNRRLGKGAADLTAAHVGEGDGPPSPFFVPSREEGCVMPCFTFETSRLLLRPPGPEDVASIAAQMNDWDVVKNLSRAPFPYGEDHARDFLARQEDGRARGADFAFAATRKADS